MKNLAHERNETVFSSAQMHQIYWNSITSVECYKSNGTMFTTINISF